MLDIEAIQTLGIRRRRGPLRAPVSLHVEEVLERIERLPDPFAEPRSEAVRIINRAQIQEAVELLALQPRKIVEVEGQRLKAEAMGSLELVRMQRLPLEFQQKRISLNRVVEEEGKIEIRTGRELLASGTPKSDHSEGTVITQGALLLRRPAGGQIGIDPRAVRGQGTSVVQFRTPNQSVVRRDSPLELLQWRLHTTTV